MWGERKTQEGKPRAARRPRGHHTEEVILGQGMQDSGGTDERTHGGRECRGVDADQHKWGPQADATEEPVVFLKQGPSQKEKEEEGFISEPS